MMYKDEYELARLYSDDDFQRKLAAQFAGDYRLRLHLAPPLISRTDPRTGRLRKRAFGQWLLWLLPHLARLRGLRGTVLDPFGYSSERREERLLIDHYRGLTERVLAHIRDDNSELAAALIDGVENVRDFGVVKHQRLRDYYKNIDVKLERYLAT